MLCFQAEHCVSTYVYIGITDSIFRGDNSEGEHPGTKEHNKKLRKYMLRQKDSLRNPKSPRKRRGERTQHALKTPAAPDILAWPNIGIQKKPLQHLKRNGNIINTAATLRHLA